MSELSWQVLTLWILRIYRPDRFLKPVRSVHTNFRNTVYHKKDNIMQEKVDYYPKLFPNQYHHCINHAVGQDLLFREADNYRYFLDKYEKYIEPITTTYAYCLMPNHFHFLLRINNKQEIIQYYQQINQLMKTSIFILL